MKESPYQQLMFLCENRKSVRAFLEKSLSQDYIDKILKIALTSPYASGKKNWEIMVVNDRTLIESIAVAVQKCSDQIQQNILSMYKEGYADYVKKFIVFKTAPVLFIPTFRITPTLALMMENKNDALGEWERDNYIKSISCVSMLILLAAESLGLGSCYMTGPLIAEQQIGTLINIKPERKIGAIIPVGYTKKE